MRCAVRIANEFSTQSLKRVLAYCPRESKPTEVKNINTWKSWFTSLIPNYFPVEDVHRFRAYFILIWTVWRHFRFLTCGCTVTAACWSLAEPQRSKHSSAISRLLVYPSRSRRASKTPCQHPTPNPSVLWQPCVLLNVFSRSKAAL